MHHGGVQRSFRARGYFIRRYEFDGFLLARSGAEVITHQVKSIERTDKGWVVDGGFRAPALVGAGGTHCPVARVLSPPRPERPVGAQELELQLAEDAIRAARLGADGEPELILHRDLRGYSWNVPKTDWLNVGSGTMEARQVKDAWREAREYLLAQGHVPAGAAAALEQVKGHSYYLFHPDHLAACQRDGALLCGDSLGLAQPLTAEGILPAVLSGRLAGEAVVAGDPASYSARLLAHPLVADYRALVRLRDAGARMRQRAAGALGAGRVPRSLAPLSRAVPRSLGPLSRPMSWAIARGFAWMFTGAPLPGWLRQTGRARIEGGGRG